MTVIVESTKNVLKISRPPWERIIVVTLMLLGILAAQAPPLVAAIHLPSLVITAVSWIISAVCLGVAFNYSAPSQVAFNISSKTYQYNRTWSILGGSRQGSLDEIDHCVIQPVHYTGGEAPMAYTLSVFWHDHKHKTLQILQPMRMHTAYEFRDGLKAVGVKVEWE